MPGRWDGLNRRKFPRVNYPCLVVVRNNEESKDVILTHTENVGVGGVCVILKKNLKIFCPVELELDLLDLGNHIRCKGRVVWNVQRRTEEPNKPFYYDIGIEFIDIDNHEQRRLDDIIARLVRNQKKVFSL